ncbi:MAG TPA: 30S ribosomal protein S8, partial [Candidatus Levybacteria bacterium]|nr:30S ribosomal protein S8 [Candidatus Levybacteria bacterium]
MAHRLTVETPYSKASLALAKILSENKYVKKVEEKEENGRKQLVVTLLYTKRAPGMQTVKIISTPSLHIYVKRHELPKKVRELGMHIVSTSKGIMSDEQAMKEGVGGKLLFQVQ